MMEIADYLKSMGITPISALLIACSVWLTSQYFKFKIEKEKDKDKLALEFLSERLKKRSRTLEELNSLLHDFDHYVNHLLEGDKGWYEKALDERFKSIRGTSRERIEFIEDDFPEFLGMIYSYTDEGRLVLSSEFNRKRYIKKKNELEDLFKQIRATLPGMRSNALTNKSSRP